MPDPIPPPGPERDAEIARLLGVKPTSKLAHPDKARSLGAYGYVVAWPPYSTDPAACDRLVEEMVRRGWGHRYEHRRDGSRFARFDGLSGWGAHIADGSDRPDAVSGAALLALRGGR